MKVKRSDLAAQSDHPKHIVYNSGFIVVKPTPLSFRAFILAGYIASSKKHYHDQKALNEAIHLLKSNKSGIKAALLDKHAYVNGYKYFQEMNRLLPRRNDRCSSNNKINCSVNVVHNNWIFSIEAKIYRFREHLLWLYDGEDQYYSSRTRKYLIYTNTKPLKKATLKQLIKQQISALRTALSISYLLKRVVILPRFYCSLFTAFYCPLNSIIYIKHFDLYFSNRYRENSFLQHPKVPDDVKLRASYHPITHSPLTRNLHITIDDVLRMFENLEDKVINIGVLDGIHVALNNHSTSTTFSERLSKAFRIATYSQSRLGELL